MFSTCGTRPSNYCQAETDDRVPKNTQRQERKGKGEGGRDKREKERSSVGDDSPATLARHSCLRGSRDAMTYKEYPILPPGVPDG